jgi:hypothetical protein
MTLRLTLLNAVLLLFLAVICASIWKHARDASTARSLLVAPLKHTHFSLPKPIPAISPLSASSYLGVAEGNLLSADRNANITLETPPLKLLSPPPLPSLSGVVLMDGFEPTILLSAESGFEKHAYIKGETIGEWQVDSFDRQNIILEWHGNRVTKPLAELMDRSTSKAVIPSAAKTPRSPIPAPQLAAKPTGQALQNDLIKPSGALQETGNIRTNP